MQPDWSPDGRQIAFMAHREGKWDIFVISAGDSNQRKLTMFLNDSRQSTWSPDGQRIAFYENTDIFVMGKDGSNPVNVTNTPDQAEFHPAWESNKYRLHDVFFFAFFSFLIDPCL